MSQQLGLELEPPKAPRTDARTSFHVRSHVTAPEAAGGEERARLQDSRVLQLFREVAKDADAEDPTAGKRLTPSQVLVSWRIVYGGHSPPITSIRRAITNLTARGLLVHYAGDRRPGPHGAMESTWGLA